MFRDTMRRNRITRLLPTDPEEPAEIVEGAYFHYRYFDKTRRYVGYLPYLKDVMQTRTISLFAEIVRALHPLLAVPGRERDVDAALEELQWASQIYHNHCALILNKHSIKQVPIPFPELLDADEMKGRLIR